MLIGDIIDEILVHETPKRREATRYRHKFYFERIRLTLGNTHIDDFTRKSYSVWIEKLRAREEGTRNTFNDYTKHLNIIRNYAYQHEYTKTLVKYPNTDDTDRDPVGRVFTNSELKRMWDASEGDAVLRLQLVLALECFLRLREGLRLTWSRVDFDERKVIFRKQDVKTGSKMGKGRVVPMSENARTMLFALSKDAKTEWVFPNRFKTGYADDNKKRWKRLLGLAKIKGRARWHDLRHTALTMAATNKGVNLANLALVAGVAVRTIQRVYLHAHVEDLREVTSAIDIKKIA